MKAKPMFYLSLYCFLLLIGLISTACSWTTETKRTLTVNRDVAETVASAIGYQTGGAIDQMGDLCGFATANGLKNLEAKYPKTLYEVTKSYDSLAGEWSIHVERERGVAGSIPYALISRTYNLQFRNEAGVTQKYYVVTGDTARTIRFSIISGEGRHQTRRISQQLDSLSGIWTITHANQPNLIINGSYYRAAVDTIRGFSRVRTSNHQLTLSFHDILAPRGTPANFTTAVSGSITGTFHAEIDFISGTPYAERVVDRVININFGNGRATIGTDSSTFIGDVNTGEVVD